MKTSIAQQKTIARLMAVQVLYSHALTNEDDWEDQLDNIAATLMDAYKENAEEGEDKVAVKYDKRFFKKIVKGVLAERAELDVIIERYLEEGWTTKKIGEILHAILLSALYEMVHMPKVPTNVVLSEYVGLTNAFFEEKEPGFINAILEKMTKEFRSEAAA